MEPFGFFCSKLFSAVILFFYFRLPIYKNPGKLQQIITLCFSKSLTTWLIKTSRKGSVNRNVHKCCHDKMHEWWMDIDVNKSGTAAVTGQAGMRSPLRFSEISYCLFWRDDGSFFSCGGWLVRAEVDPPCTFMCACTHLAVGDAVLISGQRQQQSAISGQQTRFEPLPTVSFRDTVHTHTHTEQSPHAHLTCTGKHIAELGQRETGRRCAFLFRSYFRSLFIHFSPISSEVVYWSRVARQPPPAPSPPWRNGCWNQLPLSSFSISPHPVACSQACGWQKRVNVSRREKKKKKEWSGSGWEDHGGT